MEERKPHKYAEVIKAWADGKPIQYRVTGRSGWVDVTSQYCPFFDSEFLEWRVKSENIFTEICVTPLCIYVSESKNNLRLEFDPDTKKLVKAEVIE